MKINQIIREKRKEYATILHNRQRRTACNSLPATEKIHRRRKILGTQNIERCYGDTNRFNKYA